MTRPRFAGSRLNAASCASPTPSNVTPTSHTTTPAAAIQPSGRSVAAATCSGSATNHAASPCTTNMRTTAKRRPSGASASSRS